MKNFLAFIVIWGIFTSASAQNEADKWFFGTGAALDFSSGSPVVIYPSPLNTSEGTASVADATGKLRFFTNGVDVWDSTKTVMTNGSGLMGDVSTTQSAMVVPNPASANQYYLFTAGADGTGDLRYSIVDMTLNGGLGDVIPGSKNTLLTDSITEKIAAIRDGANGIWIVSHKWGTNQFFSYHLTTTGLAAPVITAVGAVHLAGPSLIQNSYGQLKFNNCGTKLACAIGYQDIVELLDFDLATGIVSNPMTLNLGAHVYGVEFSMTSTFLYVSNYAAACKLAQYNISLPTLAAIDASKVPLTTTDDLYGLQMGPNGKIYVARSFGTPFLGVISNPEVAGFGCNYNDNGVDLDPSSFGVNAALSLPGFMQDYIKLSEGITCPLTSVGENDEAFATLIYPNPSTNDFSVDLSKIETTVSVYDATGRLVEHLPNVNCIFTFGTSYAKGMYLVNLYAGGKLKTLKAIKQ